MAQTDDDLAFEDSQNRAALAGARPALIERFGIRGLYGYRTISLASKFAATVLIARNGTGKTTLLGALDAFLKLELYRLRELQFNEIFCKIRGIPQELVLTHDELVLFLQTAVDGEVTRLAARIGIDPQKLYEFLLGDFRQRIDGWHLDGDASSVATSISRSFQHDNRAAKKACEEAYLSLFRRTPNLDFLRSTLTNVLSGFEIVYLPTYRRVELALTDDGEDRRTIRGRTRPRLNFAPSGLHTAEIQFGLGDISDRLTQLNNDIIARSNREYRAISENIINELIRGYEVTEDAEIPKPDDLRLFFSRLESGKRIMGPQYSRISAPEFERIYSSEGVPPESAKFLKYFLNKLNGIINITKEIEQPVGDFIRSCNKYLSSAEPTTFPPSEAEHARLPRIDGKALKLNPNNLRVHVESLPARTSISLDALSSGEKQMVSLFARMYLYEKRKIVLIDEPELSLSIDWQRGILVDVLLSPNCEQVIAITHSPFVFDNSLEQFARTLDLELGVNPELPLEAETTDLANGDSDE